LRYLGDSAGWRSGRGSGSRWRGRFWRRRRCGGKLGASLAGYAANRYDDTAADRQHNRAPDGCGTGIESSVSWFESHCARIDSSTVHESEWHNSRYDAERVA
jgi:hypothetical protein